LLAVFVNGEKEAKLLRKTFIAKQLLAGFVNKMLKTEHTSELSEMSMHPIHGQDMISGEDIMITSEHLSANYFSHPRKT
jgi:hypothetical protein